MSAQRCACGAHDIPGDGPFGACHFCGHPTASRPVIVWDVGRLYFAACHVCALREDVAMSVLVHDAPEALLAEAYAFGKPALEVRA